MSANLVVDLANTTDSRVSVAVGSGINQVVGEIVDLLGANTYCNVFTTGGAGSGAIDMWIQTSDTTASGNFTDPTSGLAQFPVNISSGGRLITNSGLYVSGYSSPIAPINNAPVFCSGGTQFGAFQRPHRYARLINNSGVFPNYITAGFISEKKVTGSGGGFSYSPGSGSINV